MQPAITMHTTWIVAELEKMERQWGDFRSDPNLAGGGSPGEWMVERMDELRTELKRRQSENRL